MLINEGFLVVRNPIMNRFETTARQLGLNFRYAVSALVRIPSRKQILTGDGKDASRTVVFRNSFTTGLPQGGAGRYFLKVRNT